MLEIVVFLSGALIMVLEMVGARVMAPHLGTSVIVWTSLIGVVLACLAVGAWLGGRLADKNLSFTILARILAGVGLGCALTALGHRFVGALITSSVSNIYLSAVLAAICLFAFPAVLFGMVSPYIIRLRLADIATSGATVGRLYALSTAGSIMGTFLGGFVLISFFPSTYILLGTAASMLLLSLLVSRGKSSEVLPRVLILLTLPLLGYYNASYEQRLTAQGSPPPVETLYNNIRLSQGQNHEGRQVRLMATDPGYAQSGMYINAPSELLFEYTKRYTIATSLFPKAQKILMLGGGGYSVPKWLLAGHGGLDSQNLRLDVVELDPGMTALAKSHFALPEDPRMRIFHEDARRHINMSQEKYDLIFVDVFNSHYSVPFHMGTVEAAKTLRRIVNNDGAVLMNIISAFEGKDAAILQSIYGALSQAFGKLYIFAVTPQMPLTEVQNFMVLALPKAEPHIENILKEYASTPKKNIGRFAKNTESMLHAQLKQSISLEVPPLRDEFAPVERYAQALLQ